MRPAIPFHEDMREMFGEKAVTAEVGLWIGSTILGAFACKVVYDLMKRYSPAYFGDHYTKLPKAKQVDWDNRGFSTAHAVVCCAASGYLLFCCDIFHDGVPLGPVVFRSTVFSYFTIAFSTGYFLADLAMIIWTYPSLGGLEYVLHHFLSIGSVLLANYTAHGHFYILMVLFTEISTPFINIRWYLIESGMKSSKYYLYNGLLVLLVWLFARVLLFAYFFYHIFVHYGDVKQLYPPGFYILFITAPVLAIMNLFWFSKIIAGAVKLIAMKRKED